MRLWIIFTNKQVMLCSIYSFLLFSIINAFTSLWGITFLTHVYSINRQDAANVMGMVFIGIAIGGPISGLISKQIDQSRVILIFGALFSTLVMSLVIFSPNLSLSFMFLLFLAAGAGCAVYVQCFAIVKNIVPPFVRATALASCNMIIMLGAPILQLIIGALLENHFFGLTDDVNTLYRLSLGLIPCGLFLAFLLALAIKEK
jgi:predicted MFS family arabinose efflux permease